jgi:predicted helicase
MAKIYYARVDEFWRKEQKYEFLEEQVHHENVAWQTITPDQKHNWLTEGLSGEFDTFIPMGTKEAKGAKKADVEAIFKLFSLGVATNRDEWIYDFYEDRLEKKTRKLIEDYNFEVFRYSQASKVKNIDDFINLDPTFVKWTDRLKDSLQQRKTLTFDPIKIRQSMYRPFVEQSLYFDHLLNQRRYRQPLIFPTAETENQVICVGGYGRKNFAVLMTKDIPDLNFYADPQQSFPFYTYDEDGGNRRENITDWALEQFRARYPDEPLNWRVEKMRLSKDKTQLKYNDFLTLAGIPPEVFEYKLGNRSALEWVIDQYQVSADPRSGIVNDPNNLEDEQCIVRLIGQVITVSLETVKIVKNLSELKVG